MKKLIAPMLIGATLATAAIAADDSLKAEIAALKVQMAELKEAQSKVNYDALKSQLLEVKAHDAGDNIKWTVDFRSAYDIVEHKIGSSAASMTPAAGFPAPTYTMGGPATAETNKNGIWTNKLVLGMAAQPVDNLIFKGALSMYKAYGQSSVGDYSMFQDFDWYASSKPQADSSINVKEAYFLYFGEAGDLKYTASFGRRPSTDGFMTNLRADNANPSSPVGHNINMEFDGASFKFDFEKLTGISGFYAKICLGRGFSDTAGSYGWDFGSAYSSGFANPNMDLAGLLVQAYDDGQYKVMANVFQGWNMMGMGMNIDINASGNGGQTFSPTGFLDVGDMQGASLSLQVNGIGDEINDFLDDTVFFASVAMSKTEPSKNVANTIYNNESEITQAMIDGMLASGVPAQVGMGQMLTEYQGTGMLGSQDDETGYSYYVGVNFPGFMESDRIGLEYNHGSEYWRSFTYGEDTLAGSKLATRGDAYEIYYNLPLVGKNLTAQIRYTYMDYDYAGSDMFFGQTGNPAGLMGVMPFVESASNIHLSMRYRY